MHMALHMSRDVVVTLHQSLAFRDLLVLQAALLTWMHIVCHASAFSD